MNYTELLIEADNHALITKDKPLRAHYGRIKGKRIAIKKEMPEIQKKCVLAEELGHYHTTVGDIMDLNNDSNRKQELRARLWGYDKLIGLSGIISCYRARCTNLYEMAEYLDVTEEYLKEALKCYKSKYGPHTRIDNYIIYFEPNLAIFELI